MAKFRSDVTLGSATTLRRAIRLSLAGLALASVGLPSVGSAQTAPASSGVLEEITVTARKKDETLLNVPVSITAFSAASLEKLNISTFTDYATKTPNMSFSYGTANWGYVDSHSIAIRGVSGAGTTGVYIDETPVPDSTDPRVVDIARIEILKGPQGTLFGQSSLGGNLRLITVQPTPGKDDIHYTAKLGGTSGAGSPDYGFDFAGSQTLNDSLVVRAVGFYNHDGGYVHRRAVDPTTGTTLADVNNYGAQKSYGGSLALRWLVSDRFDVLLRFMAQESQSDGWAAPYAPIPSFSVQSLTLDRTNNIQEQARDRFYLPSLQLDYKGDGYTIHESLSYFDRRATQTEDGTEGTRDAFIADWAAYYPDINQFASNNQGFGWGEIVSYRRTTSETRISFDKNSHGISGVAGVYYSHSFSDTQLDSGSFPLVEQLGLNTDDAVGGSYCRTTVGDHSCSTYGSGLGWKSFQPSYHHDAALFGEMYYEFANFELTAGGRFYRQTQSGYEFAAGSLNFAELNIPVPDTKQTGFNPKLALKYNFSPTAMVYTSFSKGFRAGGAGVPLPSGPQAFFDAIHQKPNSPTTYDSDYVKNYEVGGKFEMAGGKVVFTGALFQMDWSNIQQTIIAPVSYITLIVNAGDARVRGGEFEVDARPTPNIDLHAGFGYTDATIKKASLYWQPTGSRVYQVPKITANASATFTVPVSDRLSSFMNVNASYTGSSYSGVAGCQLNVGPNGLPNDYPASSYPNGYQFFPCPSVSPTNLQGFALERAGFTVLNARVGLDWGQSELALYVNNLTGARPNLGDFNPESYAKHDPNTGYIIPRVATLRPFNAGITFRQRF